MSKQNQKITTEEIFEFHEGGKLAVVAQAPIDDKRTLSIAYTPGVAQVSQAIHDDASLADTHTWASRLVAVVSDGTAVLGLGDIGASASLPVMEGKSALFQRFAGLNSIPLVLDTKDTDEIIETLVRLKHSFGAVNLEDISAPRCFELERKLIDALDMPVMHDDQHGTAVVVLAALINAVKVVDKELTELKVVISGAGAAGMAIAEILLSQSISDVVVLDSRGILNEARIDLSGAKAECAAKSNPRKLDGGLAQALEGADILIGVSSSTVPEEFLARMAPRSIVFAMSNPNPEVTPDVAVKYATVVATGRSDFPNQINNVLAFPGIFRGALDAQAKKITLEMKVAAAQAIAALVTDELSPEYIIPSPFDERVAPAVAAAVMSQV